MCRAKLLKGIFIYQGGLCNEQGPICLGTWKPRERCIYSHCELIAKKDRSKIEIVVGKT